MKNLFIACLLAAVSAVSYSQSIDWDGVLGNPNRSASEVEEDAARNPQELLTFFGVQSGDHAADILSGSGYYARVLANIVGPEGKVYAGNNPFFLRFNRDTWNEKFDSGAFADIVRIDGPVDEMALPRDGSLDFVLMNNVYHDLFLVEEDRAEMNQIIFDSLKPGGILGLVDHAALPGTTADQIRELHRIDKQIVLDELAAAGFDLIDESDMFANPADNYEVRIFDPGVRGKTDRFVLKYQKPAE